MPAAHKFIPQCELVHSSSGQHQALLRSRPACRQRLIARMKQLRKRILPSAHDRICPDMPEFLVSNLLRGQARHIIRPLPGAFKFVS
ncbi:hypothetical protein ACWGTI_06240 [Mesorhizobium sp. ArgA1]